MKERENKPTIIDELNKSLKDEALKDKDVPTVQNIAESVGIDETTLYSWLHNDVLFRADLHNLSKLKEINKEMLEKFPELAWTAEEKKLLGDESLNAKTEEFQIIQVLAGAKERHYIK